MKARSSLLPRRLRRGMALVVTLCFLVLLSALILGFFATAYFRQQVSNSGNSLARADLLARGAAQILVGELRAEIASTNTSRIYTASGAEISDPAAGTPPLIFQPRAGSNAVPEKRGALNSTWKNVVARSAPSSGSSPLALYTGGRDLVANSASASTATNSLNGRSVDDRIWRMPCLVADPSGDLSPRWCFVTRQGVQSVADADVAQLRNSQSSQYAVGRFAYVIYDVGGLVDLNVAGNALGSTNNVHRAYLNQIDLSRIPGLANPTALLNWRSAVSQSDTNYLFSTTNSFLKVQQGDQSFITRQDLIHYALGNSSVVSTNALPYLTTFTRELNAPSWGPTQNAADVGGVSVAGSYANKDYSDNQNSSTVPNRFVPNVRLATTTVLTGYHTDGTSYTYTVKAGEPLIQRRFPLGRLNWLGRTGPQNGGTAAGIQACFGLVWDSANRRWIYAGPSGSTAQTSIANLATVASQGRVPNFFELLQAAVLQGSLGLTTLTATGLSTAATTINTDAGYIDLPSQVVQIGANIIDQYDTDSFPTRIFFNGREFLGSENIPMISKILFTGYRPMDPPLNPGDPPPTVPRSLIKAWYEFELWNPYSGTATAQPLQYRIRLSGTGAQARMAFDINFAAPTGTQAFTGLPAQTGRTLNISGTDLAGATNDPKILDALRGSGVSITGDAADDVYSDSSASPASSFAGFYVGEWGGIDASDGLINIRPSILGGTMQFLYEYNDNGNWVTLQSFSNANDWTFAAASGGSSSIPTAVATNFTPSNMRYAGFASVDPRTLRMGLGFATTTLAVTGTSAFWNKTQEWSPTDTSQQYMMIRSFTGPYCNPYFTSSSSNALVKTYQARFADNRGSGNPTGSIYPDPFYRDRDGVQRYGDALWNSANPAQGAYPMSPVASRPQDRPVMLNRPFQSVGELGYAFRDLPFKSLDFSTSRSADAALLDLFCLNEGDTTSGVTAGLVNLNSGNPEVLSAVLSGVTLTDLDPSNNHISNTDADSLAQALVTMTSGTGPGQGPLLNKAELATRFGENAANTQVIKGRKEAAIRALAGTGQTRTWNLLIDVIAQAGRFSPAATALNQFTVEGEQRYWLHVAIDRYTGQVIDQQIEAVKN